MYGKTIILLVGLFFPFIIEPDYNFTFGQIDKETPNLNGIWEKREGVQRGVVHLNQDGDIITSTFEPEGGCWSDMLNPMSEPAPDEYYFKTKLDFSGKLTGNTIQANSHICYPFEDIVKSGIMKLTVSDDGKSLIGSIVDDRGLPLSMEYTFVQASVNEPSIVVNTVKPFYSIGDKVGIFGRVDNMGEESNVFVEVRDPFGNPMPMFSVNVPITSDGSFMTSYDFKNIDINGTYTAFAIYPNATGKDSVFFEYGLITGGSGTEYVAVTTGTIAALGAGAIFLYKQGYFKRIEQLIKGGSQNGETPDIPVPVVYVGIECGLENPELPKKEILYPIEASEINRLEQAFSTAVDDILKNRKVIKKVQDDFEFIKWCKEAKENPKKVLSKISDDIMNKFLSSISPYFGNLIVSEISVESNVSATRDKHKRIKKSVQFSLVPIEPYIEFVLYVNTQRMSSAKFIFTIETNVEVKNLTVNMTTN